MTKSVAIIELLGILVIYEKIVALITFLIS